MKQPARFTEADVCRAIRAIEKTGARLAVEIRPDGTIRLVPATEETKGAEYCDRPRRAKNL